MERIVECVPNFSEGRDMEKIRRIAESLTGAAPVRILGIEPGADANRTVITFTGSPEAVTEAAFAGVRTAAGLIDMRMHEGAHPRTGATDVLPIIPISGITLEECADLARKLAGRIYQELEIPCYCYEAAALRPERKRLEVCRHGGYEALARKMAAPELRPDFGPEGWTPTAARAGATIVGARNFLIAVNFNLDTHSTDIAREIAEEVRESGKRVDAGDGTRKRVPGKLKACKAIGWYIEEYGCAQVSMNLTDIDVTPLHAAFEATCAAAQKRGCQVTGTEIVGLVPRRSLVAAGRHFLEERLETDGGTLLGGQTSERALMEVAAAVMNLSELRPFDIDTKTL